MRVTEVLRSSARFYVAEVMVSALLGLGLIALLMLAPQDARKWNQVRSLRSVDAEGFRDAGAGAPIIVTGVLQENSPLVSEGLVVYTQQRWTTVYEPESGSYHSQWDMSQQVVPALTILVQGQPIHTTAVRSIEQSGSQHTVVPGNSGSLGEESISDELTRLIGFRNGDRVTVVGYKDADGRLVPTRLYGGTRDALLRELGIRVWGTYLAGGALILIALLILWLRPVARQKEQ